MIRIALAGLVLAAVVASVPAQAYEGEGYIGEGVQGRPHGGARAASRYLLYRHGYGYHRHPRHWWHQHS